MSDPSDSTKKMPPYPVIPIGSWAEYREIADDRAYRSWGFRGQSSAGWPLYSSLSRHLIYAKVHKDAWAGQEERILRIFRRKAHLFLDHIPPEDDSFQWLGLMQHHGAPTRLLDVTWSPYVALFFALDRGAERAAVWGFSAGEINEKESVKSHDGREFNLGNVGTWVRGCYERDFLRGNHPFVIIGEPKIMNRRLIAQSGTFMIPGVLDQPVEQILSSYENPERILIKFELDTESMREESMRALYNMNITQATIFPDLDGLARSMAYELEFHWAFDPRTMIPIPGFPAPQNLSFWGVKDSEET